MRNNFVLLAIFCLFILSCNNSSKYKSENSNVLTPEQWLPKYNEVWAICNKQISTVTLSATNFLNPEEDINNAVKMNIERIQKVEELVSKEFPELYEYTKIPEYQAKLIEQGQNAYNNIIQQNQEELNQMDQELDQQVKRNQQELELEKERMEQFLKDYKAPKYH